MTSTTLDTFDPEALIGHQGHASAVGAMMAEKFLATTPPPWDQQWFAFAYGQAIAAAGDTFKVARPDISEADFVQAQVWFCKGFEARMRELLARIALAPGALN